MIRKKLLLFMTALLLMLVVISACTKRDNLTGDNWSGIKPKIAVDTSFVMGYSYTHDGKVKGTEQHLLTGVENGISAIAVMNFSGLPEPDSMTVIEQPTLKLVASRRSPLGRTPLVLSFYKLAQNWAADSTANIEDTNISPLEIADFTVQDTIHTGGDTLTVNIPPALINSWKTDNVDGFNIIVKALNGGWLELKSNEISNGALLTFKYQAVGDTDTLEYSQRPSKDSYRITGMQDNLVDNVWNLKNLLPQRMFFRFGLPDAIFSDMNNETLDAADLKRMTINKAELVLFVKNNPYYETVKCFFYPYHLKADTLVSPTVLTDSNLEAITHTLSTGVVVDKDSVRIDITAITQAYTSGDKDKNGIVVKSNQEIQNFGSLEFWHYSNAPAGKKPYVRVTYTPPFLKGE
jgi:hypothetical protein